MKQFETAGDLTTLSKKVKYADEKRFNLRRVIYEIDRLAFNKGTRSGDYLIREKIREINEELDLYDSKIKTCEFSASSSVSYREILMFFEQNFLDYYILEEKINLLKQTLVDQNREDIEFNETNKNKKYKRASTNLFREDLEKDLKVFESNLVTAIVPALNSFICSINDLLFFNTVNECINKLSKIISAAEKEMIQRDFKKSINYFISINSKTQKKLFTENEIISMIYFLMNEMDIKSKLMNYLGIEQQRLDKIIIMSAGEFCDYGSPGENINQKRDKPNIFENNNNERQGVVRLAIKTLKILTEFKNSRINIPPPESIEPYQTGRYLFNSPGSGRILLKDIADYLDASLLFINDWLSSELVKDDSSYNKLKLLIDSLPAETGFYELYEKVNILSLRENNRKMSIWGDPTHFIPAEMAENFIENIESVCEKLKEAFIQSVLAIEFNKNSENSVLAKKINIIYDSFDNARKKIIREIRLLEK